MLLVNVHHYARVATPSGNLVVYALRPSDVFVCACRIDIVQDPWAMAAATHTMHTMEQRSRAQTITPHHDSHTLPNYL